MCSYHHTSLSGETFRPSLLKVFCPFSTNEEEKKQRTERQSKVILKDGGTETNESGKGNLPSRINHNKKLRGKKEITHCNKDRRK